MFTRSQFFGSEIITKVKLTFDIFGSFPNTIGLHVFDDDAKKRFVTNRINRNLIRTNRFDVDTATTQKRFIAKRL